MEHEPAMPDRGFTLIELLVVVAIIAILAAIALPNFIEAQTRAKVSRAVADMRSIAAAIEAYHVDQNQCPPENYPGPHWDNGYGVNNSIKLRPLTTPVAFLTALPADPFAAWGDPMNRIPPITYHYAALNDITWPDNPFFRGQNPEGRHCLWVLQSNGPDLDPFPFQYPHYDPTNGSISAGNIMRFGP